MEAKIDKVEECIDRAKDFKELLEELQAIDPNKVHCAQFCVILRDEDNNSDRPNDFPVTVFNCGIGTDEDVLKMAAIAVRDVVNPPEEEKKVVH